MALNLTINGVSFSYPQTGDEDWGTDAANWAQAVTTGMLQKAGGAFTLTAEVDFGALFGLKSTYFKSRTANPASEGAIRLAKTDAIKFRNNANDADLNLSISVTDKLQFEGSEFTTNDDTQTLTNKTIDADDNTITDIRNTNIASDAAIEQSKLDLSITDAEVDAAAAITYSKLDLDDSIVNADIKSDAAIVDTKLATIATAGKVSNSATTATNANTASAIVARDGSGNFNAGTITASLVGNVTGNASGTAASITGNLTGDVTSVGMTTTYSATLPLNKGGTGQTTKAAAFDALSPMTAQGDIIYGGSSGTGTKLGAGSEGEVLTLASGIPSWEAPAASPDQSYEISNCTITASVAANALTIALKNQAGSDASVGSPIKIGFRNATETTGTYSQVLVTGALSLVISSGSTLGHASATDEYIYVYAINNAGTIELAASTARLIDEGSVVTTTAEGGAGAADGRDILYSTTQRTGVAIRLIGRIKSNQTTAGTWASAVSEISLTPFNNRLGDKTATEIAVGYIGQMISGTNVSGVTPTSGDFIEVTSVSLTAGRWLLGASITILKASGTTFGSNMEWNINTTSASNAGVTTGTRRKGFLLPGALTSTAVTSGFMYGVVANISSPTSYYLNAQLSFSSTAPTIRGDMFAIRIG